MPECNECKSHFMNFPLEIAGWHPRLHEEFPSLYHRTPTCPICGLIGNIKSTKLKDGLLIVKKNTDNPEVILNFMAFYRKRCKDFRDGYSIAKAFLEKERHN